MRFEIALQTEKRCSTCHLVLPVSEFNVRRASVDGLQPRCRPCKRIEDRRYRAANPDIERRRNKAYQQRYPERIKSSIQHRRASFRGAGVSEADWARLVHRHGSRCAYCGSLSKLTADHVVPIARGGQHAIGNILPACGSCNSSKGSRFLVEWRLKSNLGIQLGQMRSLDATVAKWK